MLECNKEKKQKQIKNTLGNYIKDRELDKFSKERLYKLKEELERIEQYELNQSKVNRIINFYNSHITLDLDNVSKCLSLVVKVLKYYNYNEIEIHDYLEKNQTVYVNRYETLVNRMRIFKKYNCLKEVVLHKGSLLSADNNSVNNTNKIVEYIKNNDNKIDLDEMVECFQTNKDISLIKKSHN